MSIGDLQPQNPVQATIKVHGRVQQVGFRRKVDHFAQGLDLRGFVGNLEDPSAEDERYQPVGIICQGPREKVETFLKLIEVTNGYIDVEKVEVRFEETFAMRFPDFCIHRGEAEDEIGPRMDSAIVILERMDGHILDGNKDLKETFKNGFGNMGEKMGSGFNSMGEKIDSGFNSMGEKIDSGFNSMGEKIDSGFDSMGEKIDSGFDRTNESFDRLGDKIDSGFDRTNDNSESLADETRQFHRDSNDNFQRLDGKYHTVSDDLKGIRRAVERRLAIEEERVEYSVDGKDKK